MTEPTAPIVKVRGRKQNMEKKVKNPTPKKSNFLLTINLNTRYKDDDPHLNDDIEIFDKTINDILNNVQEYIKLPNSTDWNDDTIKDVDIDYTIEKGEKKNCLHVHILFKFKHFTKIQLNYEKIKQKITGDLGLENIYMYNKLVRNSGNDNILDYLAKMT
jgi:hypothetical protein